MHAYKCFYILVFMNLDIKVQKDIDREDRVKKKYRFGYGFT